MDPLRHSRRWDRVVIRTMETTDVSAPGLKQIKHLLAGMKPTGIMPLAA
jgi:hypothetical protein